MTEYQTDLNYKAEWYGKTIIVVDRFYPSSKICSLCGTINHKLTLKYRLWTCQQCGSYHDRDINASVNLMLYGIKRVGMERLELKPVDCAKEQDEAGSLHLY